MKSLNINELTDEQKIGLLFVVRGIIDEDDRNFIYEMLENKSVGGFQMSFADGYENEIAKIKSHCDYPLLICADMEKGFPAGKYKIPSVMALSMLNDEELAYQFGAVTAIEAKKHGFNTSWGPVVDLLKLKQSMLRVPRSFGSDENHVAKMACAVLKGYYDNGMFGAMKHWPGNTDSWRDGHVFKGKSKLTEDDILSSIIKPYLYAMENADLCGVMSGHSYFPAIDEIYPSSLSEKIIGMLRNTGYDGLIFTDSFAMLGILQSFGEKECYGLAIKAGNDMVLPNYRTSFKKSYEYLLNSYKKGVFSEDRLNEAVARVIKAQNFTMKEASATEVSDYQKKCFERIERDSLCMYKDDNTQTKLNEDTKKLFIIVAENCYKDESGIDYEIGDPTGINDRNIDIIKKNISDCFPGSIIKVINQYPNRIQIENTCKECISADEIVYITYSTSASYALGGTFTERILNMMLAMEDKLAAIIHLGTPYPLEMTPHFPRVIISIGGKENSIRCGLSILNGEYEPKGKLPFELNLK